MLRGAQPLIRLSGVGILQRPTVHPIPTSRGALTLPAPLLEHCRPRSRYFLTGTPALQDIDRKRERELGKQKLEARPDKVTIESSRQHIIAPSSPSDKKESDVLKSVQQEFDTVKDTFALKTIPRDPYRLGLAGTLPYLATSLSTVYLSWDLNQTWPLSNTFLNSIYLNHDTAQYLLQVLEPIQLGYGAVIISFLGAIHWGMEWSDSASKAPVPARTKFRYAVGVLAPAAAWPTLLMPIEYALISQFAAFSALYFADSTAASRGYAPTWYGTYRFVLTVVVGSAILVSLVGRAKIGEGPHSLTSDHLRRNMRKPESVRKDPKWERLEKEERQQLEEKEEKEEREHEERKAKNGEESENGNERDKDRSHKSGESGKDKGSETEKGEDSKGS